MTAGRWVQVEIQADETGRLRAHLSATAAGTSTASRPLADATVGEMVQLAERVRRRASVGERLGSELRDRARSLYGELFEGDRGRVIDQLRGDHQVLLRMMISDPRLRAVPWEMLTGPAAADGPLATHPRFRMARGVFCENSAVAREVPGAVRLLVVAPDPHQAAALDLLGALGESQSDGEIELLDPVLGVAARWPHLFARLQQHPRPHILHFICHGRVQDGQPQLWLGTGEDDWVDVGVLSSALAASNHHDLRLVYLESCRGAEPGALANAAEHLASGGVEGVVAHLWEVDASAARSVARTFYSTLTGPARGDASTALNTARLALQGTGSADFLCPVLYLLGTDPVLFDFRRRGAATVRAVKRAAPADLTPAAEKLLERITPLLSGPGTLLLGDHLGARGERLGLAELRAEILALTGSGEHESLDTLMQRYEISEARDELKALVQEMLDDSAGRSGGSDVVDLLARLGGPGLYLTLLWLPLLEEALARRHPDREILVIQPLRPGSLKRLRVYRRAAGETSWESRRGEVGRVDLDEQMVVVRLFGGYTAAHHTLLGEPVLTEDDHLAHLSVIDQLPDQVLAWLRGQPMLLTGLRPVSWSHRELMRKLLDRQALAPGSVATVAEAEDPTAWRYWTSGVGPGGRGGSVEPVDHAVLMTLAQALHEGGQG